MRHLPRAPLSPAAVQQLGALTGQVTGAPDPVAKAQALWKSKPKATFDEVRDRLNHMATGRARCMYCEDGQGTDIDHFWPKTHYPARAFDWSNYLLACSFCNSNAKRSAFPLDPHGQPLLLDPTADEPAEHLLLTPSTGDFIAVGPKGDPSIQVFGLNDRSAARRLPDGRRQALVSLVVLLKAYDSALPGEPAQAAAVKEAMLDFPFSAVFGWLVRVAQGPAGSAVLGDAVVRLVEAHGVAGWR